MARFLFFFFLFIASFAQGQSPFLDSLRARLKEPLPDTSRILVMIELAYKLESIKPDSFRYYSEKAFGDALQLDYSKGLGRYYWVRGMEKFYRSDYDTALSYLHRSLELATTTKDAFTLGRVYNSMANVYNAWGQYEKASEYYFKSLKFKEKVNDRTGTAITLNNIANVYNTQGQYDKAFDYHTRSLAMRRKLKDTVGMWLVMADIGENLRKQKRHDEGLDYLIRAYHFAKSGNDAWAISNIAARLGDLYLEMQSRNEALHYFTEALEYAEKGRSKERMANAYIMLSKYHLQEQNYSTALGFAQKAQAIALEIKRIILIRDAAFQISLAAEKLKRFDDALAAFKFFRLLDDSLLNVKSKQALFVRDYEYNDEKEKLEQEKRELNLRTDLQRQRSIIVFISIVLLFACILIFTAYRVLKMNQKAKSIIEAKNSEIANQNQLLLEQKSAVEQMNNQLGELVDQRTQELNTTIKELIDKNQNLEQFSFIVSHNLRGPVARIQGLVNLLADADSQLQKQIVNHLATSSQDLDLVLRDLGVIINTQNSIDKIKEEVDVVNVLYSVLESLRDEVNSSDAVIDVVTTNDLRITTIRPYLQSILYNLVSNAIKYRNPSRRLSIRIVLEMKSNQMQVDVADNGLGIALSETNHYKVFGLYQRMHTHVEGKGLGLFLVKKQVEALGGTITLESQVGFGTSFKVLLPAGKEVEALA